MRIPRRAVLDVTGFLWRYVWFRWLCVVLAQRSWRWSYVFVGLYTPFWWAGRVNFCQSGQLDLAAKFGQSERRWERVARIAGL